MDGFYQKVSKYEWKASGFEMEEEKRKNQTKRRINPKILINRHTVCFHSSWNISHHKVCQISQEFFSVSLNIETKQYPWI